MLDKTSLTSATASGDADWTYPLATPVTSTVNGQTATWKEFQLDPVRYRKLSNGQVVFAGAAAYELSPASGGSPTSTSINTYGYGSNNWYSERFDLFQIPAGYRADIPWAGGTSFWPRFNSASGNDHMGGSLSVAITSASFYRVTPAIIALQGGFTGWWLSIYNVYLAPDYPLWFYNISWYAEQ
jgi:hypothetical protein